MPEETWTEYRRLILSELEYLRATNADTNRKIDELRSQDVSQLKVDVAMLQVKAGFWGGGAGAIASVVAEIITRLSAT